MKLKIILLSVMLLMSMAFVVSADEPLAGPNFMGFTQSPKDVTVGATFTTSVWVNVASQINSIAIKNLSFLPAGIVNYTSQAIGNFWDDALLANGDWQLIVNIHPSSGGVHNALGYVAEWAQGIGNTNPPPPASVNNHNGTATTITWLAKSCGIVTTTLVGYQSCTAYNGTDPGTTKYTGTIRVHPQATTGFTATPNGYTQIDLSWTKHTGDDKTLIRYKSGSNPTSVTDGTLLYNDTGSSKSHTGLSGGTHVYYSAWGWNESAGLYSIYSATADAQTPIPNNPPAFGTPSPTNGSTGQNLALTWSISITDAEANPINWNIHCSNGQTASANGASGGTKTLSISGLAYLTTYTVWVNATDPAGSGLWTRAWYTFQTKANSPPAFGTPSPTNGSGSQAYSLTWSIPITDANGDLINFRISCSNGQFTDVAGATGGTKSLSISGLSPSTTYTVWVNATDIYGWTRAWYTFTTKANNPPGTPGGSDMTPRNNAPNVPINLGFLRVKVTDPDGDHMTVNFYWGNGTLIGTSSSVASGGTATISIPTLAYNTTYHWYVVIADIYHATTRGPTAGNWSYTTGPYVPIPPGGPSVHTHTVFVAVIDDATNLPIINALCKIMKGNDFQGQGLTTIYGTFSKLLKDSDQYTLTVTANGYATSVTQFTLSQKDTYITIRMHTGVAPVGLTNAQGGLSTVGFIFLAILIVTLLGVLFIWYNYYGGKKR